MRKLKLTELGRLTPEEYVQQEKQSVVVVLDNIRSAMNVGSFFRTADALAISKLFLCGITAQPPHKEITKTAIGATETVAWQHYSDVKSLMSELKAEGYTIVGIEQTTKSKKLSSFTAEGKIALVFGNEVDGLTNAILDDLDICLEIKQYGTKHSLNVSVCGGIVLWYIVNQLNNSITI